MKRNCSVTSAVEITNGRMLMAGVGSVFGCFHLQKISLSTVLVTGSVAGL